MEEIERMIKISALMDVIIFCQKEINELKGADDVDTEV